MQLWRAHLQPGTPHALAAFQLCKSRDLVGFGWAVRPSSPLTRDEYRVLAMQTHGSDPAGWEAALRAITEYMNKGDLCWSHCGDEYQIGRIGGQWEYRSDPEYRDADIVNVRPCSWFESDTGCHADVAWAQGRTLQRVGSIEAVRWSAELYNRLSAVGAAS